MRVFLENGQVRSFKYDPLTSVRDVLESLFVKLQIGPSAEDHFALVLEHPQGQRTNKLAVLDGEEKLIRVSEVD